MSAVTPEMVALLRASRKADSVSFHAGPRYVNNDRTPLAPGTGVIIITTRCKCSSTSCTGETREEIMIESLVVDYAPDTRYQSQHQSDYNCFAWIGSAEHSGIWRSVLALIRAGDDLEFVWSAGGGGNDYTRDAGLHVDSLDLSIRRKGKEMLVKIAQSITPENSARMIHRV